MDRAYLAVLGRSACALALYLAGGLGSLGCAANWHESHKNFSVPFERGEYSKAADEASKVADTSVPMDKALLYMEKGAILRTCGKLEESNASFDAADNLVGDYKQWPTVRISEEAAAALTTVRNVNYRGTLSDLVMMNTYRALNYMELGKPDAARSMLIRAGFVQQEIADTYSKELRKSQEDLDKKKTDKDGRYDVNKTLSQKDANGKSFQDKLDGDTYKDLQHLSGYSAYVNPFCDYLQGIFFLANAADQSDRERAATAFKRAKSMEPNNPYILQDIDQAERFANGGKVDPVTYVVFESGQAPEIGQVQIPLPLFLLNNQAPTVVLYFPTIHTREGAIAKLQVVTSAGTFETSTISNMDAVIMQEFKNQLPTAITRMIIGAATKAAIDAAAKQAVKDKSALAQLAVDLTSTVYQVAMNQADLRTWRTLPKQFQVARVPTPADHHLTLTLADGRAAIPLTLPDATVNLVYIRSVHTGVTPVVRQVAMGARAAPPANPLAAK